MTQWSKKRYNDFMLFITSKYGIQAATEISTKIQEIFLFDPNAATTEARRSSCQKYLAKKKEQGISTYVSSGRKNAYYRKREKQMATESALKPI